MLILFLLLIALMLIIGGRRGFLSLKSLLINAFIALLSIYLICFKLPVMLIMIVSSLLFCIVTLFCQNHYNQKTLASFLATMITLLIMSLLIYYFCVGGHLVGVNEFQFYDEEYDYVASAVDVNLLHILIASLIWGELGAVIDTSISIASAMQEIACNTHVKNRRHLFQSGIKIGHDILGTTINTLFFVALGECILLTLLYMASDYSFGDIVNSKSFFQETAGVFFSCCGCILIIPITAAIYALFPSES